MRVTMTFQWKENWSISQETVALQNLISQHYMSMISLQILVNMISRIKWKLNFLPHLVLATALVVVFSI